MADRLLRLVKDGKIPEAIIDEKVIRVLRFIFRITDNPAYAIPAKANTAENVQVARKIADESIVLLKNDGILPLTKKIKTIAIIGPSAKYQHAMHGLLGSGGSGAVTPPYEITPYQAIVEKYGKQTKIFFAEGMSFAGGDLDLIPSELLSSEDQTGLKGEYWNNPKFEGKSVLIKQDKVLNFSWTSQVASGDGVPQGLMSAKWTGVLSPKETGNYQLGTESDDGSRLYVNEKLLVDNWGNHAMQSKSKEINLEAGKAYAIRIEYANTGGNGGFKFVWKKPSDKNKLFAEAVDIAAKADVVLYFGGINHTYDTEALGWGDVKGADHADYNLIGNQTDLLQAIAKANPNLVVTLIGGTPMNVEPFVDQTKALLMAWYPGQEGGRAIADILSGTVNPSAKLPCTWGRNINDFAPHALGNYPGTRNHGIVNYDEGMFVGYRWFDKKNIEPRYPFGFGMSYSNFNLSDIKVENQSDLATTKVVVTCTVKNTSKIDGAEVVQIYTGLPNAHQDRPVKELRSYQKVFLKAGEEKIITFTLDKTAFSAYYVSESSCWKLVNGKADVFVGTSAKEVIKYEVLIK
jgi:beta-glucosidase